jgi:hypothetical protein
LNSPAGSFYFSPKRDFLWFSCDLTSDPKRLWELKRYYGASLYYFKSLLIEDIEWDDGKADDYTTNYLTLLGPLERILLIAGDYDDDDRLIPLDASELRCRADDFRAEYT